MNILVVGDILKDVYLNLDSRTEAFETDRCGIRWLDLGFNASEHHFFNRESSLGGAAITLEVLQKLGLEAKIAGSDLSFIEDESLDTSTVSYRYILRTGDQVTYLAPSKFARTSFTPPTEKVDYLYLDRSAEIDINASAEILGFLEKNPETKLIVYFRNFDNPYLNIFLKSVDLIFSELKDEPEIRDVDPGKIIYVSEKQLAYTNIVEPISLDRVDVLTHLSAYSIATATVLGSFVLGNSVESSLRYARLNMENSRLDSVLSLSELKELAADVAPQGNLELIAKNLVLSPKGILAADESGGSIHKKFEQLNIPDTYDNRRDYRNIFFTTPDLEKYVNGVILFDETARQSADDGQSFTDFLISRRVIPGIKVDQGLEEFDESVAGAKPGETYTKGLDGLEARLAEYYQMGMRFAKWRAAFRVQMGEDGQVTTPSDYAINKNCHDLAKYARACQEAGIVPIVEPELVYDGDYNLEAAADLTGQILDCLFLKLADEEVNLRACILKVNMVLAGKQSENPSTPEEVGRATAKVLKNHVPAELAGVVFLSGGQTPEQATANLAAILENGPFPWPVTFSFARALQDPALHAWQGDNSNAEKARQAFLDRLIANTEIL